MTKIYKNLYTNDLYRKVVTPTAVLTETTPPSDINPIKFYVDVQDDYFEIKCTIMEETIPLNEDGTAGEPTYAEKIYFWHKITLNSILEKNSVSDNSLWSVKYSDLFSHVVQDQNGNFLPIELASPQIHDQFASTFENKANSTSKLNLDVLYDIFVPFTQGATMKDFTYRLALDNTDYNGKKIPFVIDPTSPALSSVQTGSIRGVDLISPITVTGPETITAESTVTINVETTPGISFVYLEQVHGILPLVKVPVTNGTASFKVLTLGMSAGDEVNVKIGFKKWNNVVEYTKTIS
jgi:hypothetical protein